MAGMGRSNIWNACSIGFNLAIMILLYQSHTRVNVLQLTMENELRSLNDAVQDVTETVNDNSQHYRNTFSNFSSRLDKMITLTNAKFTNLDDSTTLLFQSLKAEIATLSSLQAGGGRVPAPAPIAIRRTPSETATCVPLTLDCALQPLSNPMFEHFRVRIKRSFPFWMSLPENARPTRQQTIVFYLGVIHEYKVDWDTGEIMQWADAYMGLLKLGHTVHIPQKSWKSLKQIPAAVKRFDWFWTDYVSVQRVRIIKALLTGSTREKIRILDAYGTQAEFNDPKTARGRWALPLNLDLSHFLSYYPGVAQENTFLGFATLPQPPPNGFPKRKRQVLLWGKNSEHIAFQNPQVERFLRILSEYFEIHCTVWVKEELIPKFVINHGKLAFQDYFNLLYESAMLVGTGFPFWANAPLDALSAGASVLNPRYKIPKNRDNEKLLRGKPTLQSLTSQNPFIEKVGPPRGLTIDIHNEVEVREALKNFEMPPDGSTPENVPSDFRLENFLARVKDIVHG